MTQSAQRRTTVTSTQIERQKEEMKKESKKRPEIPDPVVRVASPVVKLEKLEKPPKSEKKKGTKKLKKKRKKEKTPVEEDMVLEPQDEEMEIPQSGQEEGLAEGDMSFQQQQEFIQYQENPQQMIVPQSLDMGFAMFDDGFQQGELDQQLDEAQQILNPDEYFNQIKIEQSPEKDEPAQSPTQDNPTPAFPKDDPKKKKFRKSFEEEEKDQKNATTRFKFLFIFCNLVAFYVLYSMNVYMKPFMLLILLFRFFFWIL